MPSRRACPSFASASLGGAHDGSRIEPDANGQNQRQVVFAIKEGLPFVSLLTDPTTGGVTASFAMLGDLNISEPNALIGFAGPRVVKETIGKDLPAGFQRAEFVLEHGFLDAIVPRVELKEKLAFALKMLHTQE